MLFHALGGLRVHHSLLFHRTSDPAVKTTCFPPYFILPGDMLSSPGDPVVVSIIVDIIMFCFYFILLLLRGLQQETYKVDLAAPCYSVLRPLFPCATCLFSQHLAAYKPAARSHLHWSLWALWLGAPLLLRPSVSESQPPRCCARGLKLNPQASAHRAWAHSLPSQASTLHS